MQLSDDEMEINLDDIDENRRLALAKTERIRRNKINKISACMSICVAAVILLSTYIVKARAVDVNKTTDSVVGGIFFENDTPKKYTSVTNASLNKALDNAQAKWELALGHKIKRPVLLSDDPRVCEDQRGVIACADTKNYRIYIAAIYYADPETVLMHELGHLLGVPHIEGDELMSSAYGGIVAKPTKFAVAIAKVAGK